MRKDFGIVLLAAGNSSRLGRPKQTLAFKGKSLLRHSIDIAIKANIGPIMVVLGANAATIVQEIPEGVHCKMNENWSDGMASSIVCGVRALIELHPAIEGGILMVCDQAFISAALINELILTHQHTQCSMVTCSYGNTFGPPTFFHKSIFPELMELTGDTGARSILKKHATEVASIPFPEGVIDIDTESDYQKIAGQQ